MSLPTLNMRSLLAQCASPTAIQEQGFECQYTLAAESAIFLGHFPHKPLLPAVVQCLMVQRLVEEVKAKKSTLYDIVDAKFTAPIVPPCTVLVRVAQGRKEGQWAGAVLVGDAVCAKIVLREHEG